MLRLALVLVTVMILSPAAPAQRSPSDPFLKALGVAQAAVPGGILIRARTEMKNMAQIRGFYFWVDGRLVEIEVDRMGKIIKDTQKDKIPVSQDVVQLVVKQNKGKAKLPDGRLLEIAAKTLKDAPLSDLTYDIIDGKLVLRVGDIVIDAQTGTIITEQ